MLDSPIESQRILAVDDNTYTLRIVQHTLEMAGYEVITAVSGQDALKMINRYGMPHCTCRLRLALPQVITIYIS